MKKLNILYLFLLVITPVESMAKHNFMTTIGIAAGGAAIVEKDNSSSLIRIDGSKKLRAGTGLQAEIGYQFGISKNTALGLLMGYKYNDVNFTDTWQKMQVFPTSFLYYHKRRRISFGVGMTYHIKPTYTSGVKIAYPNSQNDTARFSNALGFSALFAIQLTRSNLTSLEFRYTNITYRGAARSANLSGGSTVRKKSTYDASNLSLLCVFRF